MSWFSDPVDLLEWLCSSLTLSAIANLILLDEHYIFLSGFIVSSTVSEYQFLSSTTPTDDKVFDLNIDKKFLRFKFKDHLTTVALDYRNNIKDEYTNVFKADTNINPNIKPKNVRIGIASSGLIKLPIQDITYSGTLSS